MSDLRYMKVQIRHSINLQILNWNVCLSSGTLQTCSLNGIVRKEDLVVSEYLTTLLVVVTRWVTHLHFKLFYLYFSVEVFVCGYSCVVL